MPLALLALLVLGALLLFRPNAAWVDGMRAAIARNLPNLSEEGKRIILAQAALESGFGKTITSQHNNPWNLIAAGWTGRKITAPDGTVDDPKRVQSFRVYESIDIAVQDFWRLIGIARYDGARESLQAGDAQGYVSALSLGGYFEVSPDSYLAGVLSAMAKV